MAEYAYDAWGNHRILVDTNGIGTLNAIRYRGYYFDSETGLYYLKSRYYDAETGRFINQDDISVLKQSMYIVNGLNLVEKVYIPCKTAFKLKILQNT